MIISITVAAPMMAVIMMKVAVTVAVPMVIVLSAAAITLPIPFKKHLSVMMGGHPVRGRIGRARPISVVPPISIPDHIPVAIHP